MASNHHTPSYEDTSSVDILLLQLNQMHEGVSSGIEKDSICRNHETPEIKATAALEQGKNVDIKLEKVVECYAEEYSSNNLQGSKRCRHDRQSRGEGGVSKG